MPKSVVNNRQIAKNTIFLYIRMIVVMLIGLYTVRAYLSILGETDYGLYNVIGGVVGMFAFLNSTLATASQRYFSQALVRQDKNAINRVFCLNLTIYMILIAVIVVVLETVGLWFVNTKLTIPPERMKVANIVYQISILTFAFQMFTVSFNALIVSHEKMKAFAYIGVLEAVLRLGFVFVLRELPFDKLMSYAIFMFLMHVFIAGIYYCYCRKKFEESRFRFYWKKKEAMEMLNFSGWHIFGTFSMVIRSQGINILLNLFFNPAVNAARAVAYQVYHAVSQLSSNFFTAVKPQIYKSYEAGEKESLYKLIMRSTTMCSFLVAILVFPILANTPYILGLWLEKVPDYTIIFTQLVLINGLVDSTSGPTIASALATGNIKKYQLIVSTLIILNLPVSYLALKLGAEPTATMIISIIISIIASITRGYLLKSLIGLPFGKYLLLFTKIILSTVFIFFVSYYSVRNKADSIPSLLFWSAIVALFVIIVYFLFVFNREDLRTIKKIIINKINK